MRPSPCPRLCQAEAMRDGRLAGAERASFERHAAGCPACAREVQELDDLAQAVRGGPAEDEAAGGDELHAQRERTRLIAAFDRMLVAPERRWPATRLLLPAAVVALVAGGFALWRVRAPEPARAAVAVVEADRNAAWSSVQGVGNREEITLRRGSLRIRVDHRSRSPSGTSQLLVVLPDGELEDIGTTFIVTAEDGRTTRVAVEEGSVVLRLRGQPPITVGAGGSWTRQVAGVPAGPDPALPAALPAPRAPDRPPASAAARRHPGRRLALVAPVAPVVPVAPAAPVAPDPARDFRAALATLTAGEHRAAAAAFAAFLARHPRDARAEDAGYLRVIALQRCGASVEMRAAAQEYLRRHPAGFRHAEVEALSR
jgi:hypothetical protein